MATSEDGSWLSTPGPYQDFIKSLCAADPTLRKRDRKAIKRGIPWPGCTPRLVVLDVQGEAISRHLETSDLDEIQKHFELRKSETTLGRRMIYILEGLSPAFVGVLGSYLMMHPAFFANHNRVSRAAVNHRGEENLLPSIAAGKDHVCLKYSELVALPAGFGQGSGIHCAETGRQISTTRTFGDFSEILMLSRKCSFWSCSTTPEGGWNMVVLCDPPIRMASKFPNQVAIRVPNEPWEGGYVDFLPQRDQMKCSTGPPRTAMLDDLSYYLQTHSQHLNLGDSLAPTFFVRKIVACHYARQLEYLRKIILKVQQKLAHHIDLSRFTITEVESQWSDVQTLERRIIQYCRDLTDIMTQLHIPENAGERGSVGDWKNTESDFQFLYSQCQALQHRAEMLNSSITALASIVGNRQAFKEQQLSQLATERSVREARRARAIVLVGLVFIPLSLTSSLFSMSQPYGPGQEEFWVYFAVSIPFAALVILVYYVFDMGFLQDDRRWSTYHFDVTFKEWTDEEKDRSGQF
ncbi:hypothetical protein FALCPG4_015918 [Fusarium falciforme]